MTAQSYAAARSQALWKLGTKFDGPIPKAELDARIHALMNPVLPHVTWRRCALDASANYRRLLGMTNARGARLECQEWRRHCIERYRATKLTHDDGRL